MLLHAWWLASLRSCRKQSLPAVQAFEMYAQQGKWEAAHKVAAGYLSEQEVSVSMLSASGCTL